MPVGHGSISPFCMVGQSIDGTAPSTTSGSDACKILVTWSMATNVVIDQSGHFRASMASTPGADGGVDHHGTCTAEVTASNGTFDLDGIDCRPADGDDTMFDPSSISRSTLKRVGKCLSIDNQWFEQAKGSCAEHDAENKFNAVGDAIQNAS